ncbi:MAG: hypothetical protein K0S98_2806, partial [Propionibacteriaceae bacterium]|nr:hypothetical protein [Propionibacteriaceae bacterium]
VNDSPLPDTRAAGEVLQRLINLQVLQLRLLIDHD